MNHLFPLELEEPARFEMTALLKQLVTDTMTLYKDGSKYRTRVGRDGYIRPDYAHKMIIELREQGPKPGTIGYEML